MNETNLLLDDLLNQLEKIRQNKKILNDEYNTTDFEEAGDAYSPVVELNKEEQELIGKILVVLEDERERLFIELSKIEYNTTDFEGVGDVYTPAVNEERLLEIQKKLEETNERINKVKLELKVEQIGVETETTDKENKIKQPDSAEKIVPNSEVPEQVAETDWINSHIRTIESTREELRKATESGISDWEYFMQAEETHSMYYGILDLGELKNKYKELELFRLENEEGYGLEVKRKIINSVHEYRKEYSKHLKKELKIKRNNFKREIQEKLEKIAMQKEKTNKNIERGKRRLENITNGAKEGEADSTVIVGLIREGKKQIKELEKEETLLVSLLRGLEQGYGVEYDNVGQDLKEPEQLKPETEGVELEPEQLKPETEGVELEPEQLRVPVPIGTVSELKKIETENSNLPVEGWISIYSRTCTEHAGSTAIDLYGMRHAPVFGFKRGEGLLRNATKIIPGLLKLPLKAVGIVGGVLTGTEKKHNVMQANVEKLTPSEFDILMKGLTPDNIRDYKLNNMYLQAVYERYSGEQMKKSNACHENIKRIEQEMKKPGTDIATLAQYRSLIEQLEMMRDENKNSIRTFYEACIDKTHNRKNIEGSVFGVFNPDNREEMRHLANLEQQRNLAINSGDIITAVSINEQMTKYRQSETKEANDFLLGKRNIGKITYTGENILNSPEQDTFIRDAIITALTTGAIIQAAKEWNLNRELQKQINEHNTKIRQQQEEIAKANEHNASYEASAEGVINAGKTTVNKNAFADDVVNGAKQGEIHARHDTLYGTGEHVVGRAEKDATLHEYAASYVPKNTTSNLTSTNLNIADAVNARTEALAENISARSGEHATQYNSGAWNSLMQTQIDNAKNAIAGAREIEDFISKCNGFTGDVVSVTPMSAELAQLVTTPSKMSAIMPLLPPIIIAIMEERGNVPKAPEGTLSEEECYNQLLEAWRRAEQVVRRREEEAKTEAIVTSDREGQAYCDMERS